MGQVDNLAHELEAVCGRIAGNLQPYGSVEQLNSLTPEQVERAMNIVRMQKQRLVERKASIFNVDADREEFNVTLSDLKYLCVDDILAKFQGGDVIEIYDANFVQLYHNWIFHYYCSYDLLTLVTEPIWKLYSRPQEINNLIGARAQEVMATAEGPERWNIPVHYLKEAKLRTPRVFEIDFQWICPVRNTKGVAVAFVSTLKATPKEILVV